jgi:MFS family permease
VTLAVLALVTILLHLAFAGMRVALSLFALHLGASAFTVGVVISLLAAIPIVFAVSWGRHIDRVGVRRPMLAGIAGMLAALAAGFAVPRLETLFVVSALAGAGFMLFHIAVNQAAGLIGTPEERARNFSLLALAFSTSSFIGPMVAGFSIDAVGYRSTFLVLGAAALATLFIMLRQKSDVRRPPSSLHPAERRRAVDLLRIPALRRVLVVSALLSMAWDLFTFLIPIYGAKLGLSASVIGLILGAFGAAVFTVRLLLPLLVRRVRPWPLLIGAMFATAAALALLPMMTSVTPLMSVAFLLGLGLGATQPMIMAMIYERAPSGRAGEAVGVRTLLLNLSQAGIPLVFGALGAALGMAPVFWTTALLMAAGGWYAHRGAERPSRDTGK